MARLNARRLLKPPRRSAPSHLCCSDRAPLTFGLPRLADVLRIGRHVAKVRIAEITRCARAGQAQASWALVQYWNKIGKHGHAYETTPEPSTRGVVDITQDVRLKLQLLQSILDYIADAYDTG